MPYFKKEKRLSHEGHLLYKYTADASHHHVVPEKMLVGS